MQIRRMPTLNHLFFHCVDTWDRASLLTQVRQGQVEEYSTARFRASVMALARFFREAGLQPHDRVALLAENCPEWHVTDFAVLLCGMVLVPIYAAYSASQIARVLEHSGASALIVSSEAVWRRVQECGPNLPDLRLVIALARHPDAPGDVQCFGDIIDRFLPEAGRTETEIREESLRISPDSMATLLYTSGTTGIPKGVMLTHRNITFDLEQGLRRLGMRSAAQALSVLPLAHVFERLLCYGYFQLGIPIAYGDPHSLAELVRIHRPAVMGVVPRILEKIRESVLDQVSGLSGVRRLVAQSLLKAGAGYGSEGILGHNPTASQRASHALADLLVFRKVRAKLGGRLQYIICGGARLDPLVERFFCSAGFRVLQGYGLTETSPVVSLAPFGAVKPGTVGKPLDDVTVAIAEDGEILVRGENVTAGYYKEPAVTEEAFRDGWFRTGDLGMLDPDGYLVVTGRKKEMIVTSGGKNVHPAAVEEELNKIPFIQRAFVVGDGRKFVAALIVPNIGKLLAAAQIRPDQCPSLETLSNDPCIRELLWVEIRKCQSAHAEWERVKTFDFLGEEVLTDPELVTPTQKLRRAALETKYRNLIDQFYTNQSVP